MRKLKTRVFWLKSKQSGGCQFCDHTINKDHSGLIFSSGNIIKLSINGVDIRFCPIHFKEFYNDLRKGVLNLRSHIKQPRDDKQPA